MKFSKACASVAVCCELALWFAPAPPEPCSWDRPLTNRTHGCPGYSVFVKVHYLHLHHHIIIAIESDKATTAVTYWQ
jgi:hypothetical protein